MSPFLTNRFQLVRQVAGSVVLCIAPIVKGVVLDLLSCALLKTFPSVVTISLI